MEFEIEEPGKSFENLNVWKRSCRLAVSVYQALGNFPDRSLKDQMTRAVVSIASNIAEGHERNSPKDFIRFLRIAKGSTGELKTQLYIAQAIGYLGKEACDPLAQECREISAMIQGLIRSIPTDKPKASDKTHILQQL
ncbi:four helix bundle protein [Cerasicoccus arenae]|uniref:four helix bundle protein n=1 Tax=Cerasicoccus arenae TaxID=424488 RepID=UPI0019071108|nr:four helix bundle protein [Cerasicoccus arenae]MBK1859169.1 four helix bundle protein [Cerasicoccus arenae]